MRDVVVSLGCLAWKVYSLPQQWPTTYVDHFDTQDVSAEGSFADASASKIGGHPYTYSHYDQRDSQAYESQPEQQQHHQSQAEEVYGGGDHDSQAYVTHPQTQDVFSAGGDEHEHEYGQVFDSGAGVHDQQQAFGGAAGLEKMKQEDDDPLAALADASYFPPAAAAAAPRSNFSQ